MEDVPDISWGCEIYSVENATSLQRWLSDSGLPAENGYRQSRHRKERTPRVSEPKKRRASLLISDDSVWTNGEAGEMMKRDEVPDWPLIATYLIRLRQNLICTWKLHRFENGQSKESLMLLGLSGTCPLVCGCGWKTDGYVLHQTAEILKLQDAQICIRYDSRLHPCRSCQSLLSITAEFHDATGSWRNLDFPPVQQMCNSPRHQCYQLPMDDGKDRAMFVVFDKEMTKLTKQEAVVLALEEIPNGGDEELPSCLGELARKEFFFQIRVTLSNFTIPSLYDQLSLKISSLTIRLCEAVVAPKLGMGGDTATRPGIEEVEKTCKSRR
ncbi:hypothetical protein F2Q69_00047673 [Brassica cretica]|uniref:Uncharacterized protein n=1 Tax=Brassica cretica TaxID=69181 RepID=A0A8S9Q8A6_BRACR|nr:hypothetical protein F2Q69_00047673 [Brassica cretica]